MSSEKVAVTLAVAKMPVAPAEGLVLVTLGAWVGVVPVAHSAFRQPAPEQALRALRRVCRVE